VGPRSRFVGELSGEDDVVVAGRVEGTVRASERVTVAPGGDVEGDIHARTVFVQGRVHGQIFAGEKAELSASAVVEGSVEAPKIVISEGARLEGTVAMAPRGERDASRKSEG
jgi:cytoskeletal protein CcmA (bactofilin family)